MRNGIGGASGLERPKNVELALFLMVLVGGLALRLRGLGSFPFWEDELYSIQEARDLFGSRAEDGILARPLYFLAMNLLTTVLPHTEWGFRIPALVLGTALVALAWFVARSLAGGWAGLLAAVTVALAPGPLFTSTIHRYWSLIGVEALGFAWLAVRAFGTDSPRDYRRALVVWIVGSATHPLFLPVVAAVGLGACVDLASRRPGWRWPTRNACLNLWVPGLLLLLSAWGLIASTHGIRPMTQIGLTNFPFAQRLRIAPAVAFALTPIVAVGCVLGALRLRRSTDPSARHWAAATLVGAPIAFGVVLALSAFTPVTALYATALAPLLFVAFGGLCAQITGSEWPRPFGPVLVALTVAAMLPSTVSYLADGGRFDFRPAFDAIRRSDPSLPVVMSPIAVAAHYAPDLRRIELLEDGRLETLEELRNAHRAFWLVLNERRHGISFDPQGKRIEFASRHCTGWGEFGRVRLDYEMYRVRLYRCDG